MQTQCPECQTTFNITQQHLNIANGQVRCTQCQAVFDGYAHMQNSISPEPPQLDDIADDIASLGSNADISPQSKPKPSALIYSDLLEDDYNKPRLGSILAQCFFTVLSLLLLAVLLLQLAYLKRNELAKVPELAPYIHQACNTIPQCVIPIQRALEQFQLESRHVYAHPNIAKALVVTVTFRNNASFTQPYPTLLLSMSNVRGQEVATRRFLPDEYLDKFSDVGTGMASQQSSSISLELADPGDQAMAFEIDFQ